MAFRPMSLAQKMRSLVFLVEYISVELNDVTYPIYARTLLRTMLVLGVPLMEV